MAGYVHVYKTEGFQGAINIGSVSLRHLLKYLDFCQPTSAILRAEPDFDPWKDYGHSNYVALFNYSDAAVSEIARLLVEGADPSDPFWTNHTLLYDADIIEEKRQKGIDVEAEIHEWQSAARADFLKVVDLIHERLSRTSTND